MQRQLAAKPGNSGTHRSRVEGKTVTIHRTWLSPDGNGKAPVDSPRKQFSSGGDQPATGSAICLDKEIDSVLHVAEGLETALAVLGLEHVRNHFDVIKLMRELRRFHASNGKCNAGQHPVLACHG